MYTVIVVPSSCGLTVGSSVCVCVCVLYFGFLGCVARANRQMNGNTPIHQVNLVSAGYVHPFLSAFVAAHAVTYKFLSAQTGGWNMYVCDGKPF